MRCYAMPWFAELIVVAQCSAVETFQEAGRHVTHAASTLARSYGSVGLAVFVTLALAALLSFSRRSPHERRSSLKHRHPDSSTSLDKTSQHQWQLAKYGHFKYCGLRDDPFSGEATPRYQFHEAPAMAEPELTPELAEKVTALRELLSDLSSADIRLDTNTLCRFLRARRGHVRKAEKLVRKAHRQHVEHRFDQIWESPVVEWADYLKPWYHSGAFLGHTFDGYPVALERLGWGKFHELCNALPIDVLLKLDHLHLFRALGALEEDAARRGTSYKQCVFIADCSGLSLDAIRPSVLMTFRKLVDFRDTVIPENTKAVLIVNAPRFLASAWNTVSRIALTPETAAKVQIATAADSLGLLRRHLADKTIPAYLGGSLCINGDPECRTLIAPGGPVPAEILEHVRKLSQRPKSIDRRHLLEANKNPEMVRRVHDSSTSPIFPALNFVSSESWTCCWKRPEHSR